MPSGGVGGRTSIEGQRHGTAGLTGVLPAPSLANDSHETRGYSPRLQRTLHARHIARSCARARINAQGRDIVTPHRGASAPSTTTAIAISAGGLRRHLGAPVMTAVFVGS